MFQNFEKICLSIWIFFICRTEHLVGLFSVRLMFFSCRNLFTMFLIIFCLLFVSILSGILCFQRLELLGLIFSLLFSIFSSFLLSGRFPWLYLLIFRMYFIYLIFYLFIYFTHFYLRASHFRHTNPFSLWRSEFGGICFCFLLLLLCEWDPVTPIVRACRAERGDLEASGKY